MEKIVLLTDFYYPKPSANGICIKKIADRLKLDGHKVYIVAYKIGNELEYELIDGIDVFRIKAPLFYQCRESKSDGKFLGKFFGLSRLLRYGRIIFFAPIYPMVFPIFALRYSKLVNQIICKFGVSKIVSEYLPIEAVYSGYIAKKKYKDIVYDVYVVDTFTQGINEISHPFFSLASSIWELKFIKRCDAFFCLENYKDYYENEKYGKYKNKIYYVGLPLIQNNCLPANERKNKEICFIYTGSWGNERDPSRIFSTLNEMKEDGLNIKFIYCGFSNDLARDLSKRYDFFYDMGYVDNDNLKIVCKNVDFLISIGNSTNMLPSKLFTYISFGIPILHFYLKKTDPCINYLNQYKYSSCMQLECFTREQFEDAIYTYLNQRMEYKDIEANYYGFTAECLSKMILKE